MLVLQMLPQHSPAHPLCTAPAQMVPTAAACCELLLLLPLLLPLPLPQLLPLLLPLPLFTFAVTLLAH
jgi:hypothetical protein